jgi:polyhydroxyalkanoate synthesis repressor PhaR
MITIKRYPNRKLYDTNAKQYITLAGIAQLIKEEHEVQVVDNVTGSDLTALTLTQIIYEQEKNEGGIFPRTLLANVIKTGGARISALQQSIPSPRGIIHMVDDEIRRRINYLVKQGEMVESDGKQLIEQLSSPKFLDRHNNISINDEIDRIITQRSIPTKDEIENLNLKLEILARKLDEL